MSEKIALREVGMRDGLQSIAEIMPTATKIAWLDAEYAAGVRHVWSARSSRRSCCRSSPTRRR
jgi:hypothetical protein